MGFRQFLESNEKVFYIMRGVPGSGKSHKAKQLAGGGAIFSTDDLFGDDYRRKWDQAKRDGSIGELLRRLHGENFKRTVAAMDQGVTPIVLDNTNINLRDYTPYKEAAEQRGYRVEIAESDFEPWQQYRSGKMSVDDAANFFAKNNTHGVPIETILKMLGNFHESSLRDIIEPIPQSQKWHKEGNVFKHTRLVRKAMQVAIGLLQDAAADPNSAFSELDASLTKEDMNMLRIGGWMHDIGKAGATSIGNEKRAGTYRRGVPFHQYDKPVNTATDKISAASHEQPQFFEPQMQKLGLAWQKMHTNASPEEKDDLWFMIQHHMSLGSDVFNKVKHKLVNPETGKYINDRKIKLLLLLILMDQMGRFGTGEPQFGLANGLTALRAMQTTADQMKASHDKQNVPKVDPFSTPESLRSHLQSKGLTPAQIDQNVKKKFGEYRAL